MTVNPLTEGLTPEQKKFVAENPACAASFFETEPLSPQMLASLEALKSNNRRFKQQKQAQSSQLASPVQTSKRGPGCLESSLAAPRAVFLRAVFASPADES